MIVTGVPAQRGRTLERHYVDQAETAKGAATRGSRRMTCRACSVDQGIYVGGATTVPLFCDHAVLIAIIELALNDTESCREDVYPIDKWVSESAQCHYLYDYRPQKMVMSQ